jgi:hypothetical protein
MEFRERLDAEDGLVAPALARTAARWDTRLTTIKKMAERAAKSSVDR